jgi:site-specific recombinase XerD
VHLAAANSYIRVQGKGRKEREVGLGRNAALAVSRYVSRSYPDATAEWVFLADDGRKMTPNGVERSFSSAPRRSGKAALRRRARVATYAAAFVRGSLPGAGRGLVEALAANGA